MDNFDRNRAALALLPAGLCSCDSMVYAGSLRLQSNNPSRSAAIGVALLGVVRADHSNRAYHNSKQCLRTDGFTMPAHQTLRRGTETGGSARAALPHCLRLW